MTSPAGGNGTGVAARVFSPTEVGSSPGTAGVIGSMLQCDGRDDGRVIMSRIAGELAGQWPLGAG